MNDDGPDRIEVVRSPHDKSLSEMIDDTIQETADLIAEIRAIKKMPFSEMKPKMYKVGNNLINLAGFLKTSGMKKAYKKLKIDNTTDHKYRRAAQAQRHLPRHFDPDQEVGITEVFSVSDTLVREAKAKRRAEARKMIGTPIL